MAHMAKSPIKKEIKTNQKGFIYQCLPPVLLLQMTTFSMMCVRFSQRGASPAGVVEVWARLEVYRRAADTCGCLISSNLPC